MIHEGSKCSHEKLPHWFMWRPWEFAINHESARAAAAAVFCLLYAWFTSITDRSKSTMRDPGVLSALTFACPYSWWASSDCTARPSDLKQCGSVRMEREESSTKCFSYGWSSGLFFLHLRLVFLSPSINPSNKAGKNSVKLFVIN